MPAFIIEQCADLPVAACFRVLGVSRSGFYQRTSCPVTDRELEEAHAANLVHGIWNDSRRAYGAPRIRAEARLGRGIRWSKTTCERLMKIASVQGIFYPAKPRRRNSDGAEADPGQDAVDEAQRRIDAFIETHRLNFPAAARCISDDRQALTTFLRLPAEHHRRIRHTNLIERPFGETRRRVKVIGRMPGEASCLSLVFATLERASAGWRGLTYTPMIAKQMDDIRVQLQRKEPDRHSTEHTGAAAATVAA